VTPYTYNLGTTEWTTTTAAVGTSSLQLNDPGNVINYVGVKVTNLGNPLVKDFDGWSYWTMGRQFHGVNFWMFLDTPLANYAPGGVDYGYDIMLQIMPYNTGTQPPVPGNTWVNLQSSGAYPYAAWGLSGPGYLGGYDLPAGSNSDLMTWSDFQALDKTLWGNNYDFGEATVKMVVIRMGGGGHSSDNIGYLDDFTLDGVTIQVENGFTVIPEPASVIVWSLLAGLGITVGCWQRRRKAA
jgi:hypothetical protein